MSEVAMEQVSEIGKSLPEIVLGDGLTVRTEDGYLGLVAIKPLLRVAADIFGAWHHYQDEDVLAVWRDGTLLWRKGA